MFDIEILEKTWYSVLMVIIKKQWCSCHHGMAHPEVADGRTASRYGR
jgi:hypothetical protein